MTTMGHEPLIDILVVETLLSQFAATCLRLLALLSRAPQLFLCILVYVWLAKRITQVCESAALSLTSRHSQFCACALPHKKVRSGAF